MIHQFRDKKQIAKKRRLIKNLIFLVVFLAVALTGIFSYMNGVLHFLGRPIWQAKNVVVDRASDASYLVHTKASIFKQNENLVNENKDLKLRMVDYEILKTENAELKDMFNRGVVAKDFILANILTKPNYSPYDTLIIDIGSNVSIKVGDKVYSNTVIPIGEITAVYDDTALVTLYSNPGNVTEAMLDGTNTSIELVGRGGGNFETTIPTDLQFVKGGIVYLPDISTEVVAIIEDVISRPTDPAKKLLLSSPVNVQNIKWVFVRK